MSQSRPRDRFVKLAVLTWAVSAIPNFLNFWAQPHLSVQAGGEALRTPAATGAVRLLTIVLCSYCVLIFLQRRPHSDKRLPFLMGLLAFAPLLIFVFSSLINGQLTVARAADSVVAALVIGACCRLRPNLRNLFVVGYLASASCALSLVLLLLKPENAYFVDTFGSINNSTKALIGSNQLAGIFGHSNTLGIVAGVSIAILACRKLTRSSGVAMALAAAALVGSSSRTTLIAALFVFAAVVAGYLYRTTKGRPTSSVTLLPALALLIVPLVTTSPRAFTSRGLIWQGSLSQMQSSWTFGLGPDWYATIGSSFGALGAEATSGHNLFIHVLTTTGVLGVLVYAGLYCTIFIYQSKLPWKEARIAVLYCTMILSVSILEYPWNFRPSSETFLVVTFAHAAILVALGSSSSLTKKNFDEVQAAHLK